MEIVPWKPVLDVIALQLWPLILYRKRSPFAPRAPAKSGPVILLGWKQDEQIEQMEEGPSDCGPTDFEFKTQAQPNMSQDKGQRRGRGQPRKVLSLPAPSGSTTPVVATSVRRSSRVNKGKDGYHTPTVRLEEEPSKKRNKIGAVLINDDTGTIGPLPIEILQDWGIKCGIAPEKLSQEALMQEPNSDQVPNE
jgi:hypothetical protein